MRRIRQLLDLLPAMLMWLVLSVFLWGFVFNLLTDTTPDRKIVLFADAPLTDDTALAVLLEENIAEPVKMVQARSFSYAMMGSESIESADLYIVGESQVQTYQEWFAPLPDQLLSAGELLEVAGVPCGVKVYDAQSGEGAATAFITYVFPGREAEDFYLFFGRSSLHVQSHENAVDDQAVSCALRLLDIP